ncbi:MAG: PTS glucose transporter subunit IIA, partial [Bulleidia sp.]
LAFVLTNILWKEDSEADAVEAEGTAAEKAAFEKAEAPKETAITTEAGAVLSPVNGRIIPASEIPDAVFAGEAMGPSIGIEVTDDVVYAPFDGEVVMVFPTNHAVGLKSDTGMEVLIHVGVDTVNMNGDGFRAFVKQGDKVKAGQELLQFDRKKIKAAGHPDTVIVVLTNGTEFKDVKKAA